MLKTILIGAGVLVEARVDFAALLDIPFSQLGHKLSSRSN